MIETIYDGKWGHSILLRKALDILYFTFDFYFSKHAQNALVYINKE